MKKVKALCLALGAMLCLAAGAWAAPSSFQFKIDDVRQITSNDPLMPPYNAPTYEALAWDEKDSTEGKYSISSETSAPVPTESLLLKYASEYDGEVTADIIVRAMVTGRDKQLQINENYILDTLKIDDFADEIRDSDARIILVPNGDESKAQCSGFHDCTKIVTNTQETYQQDYKTAFSLKQALDLPVSIYVVKYKSGQPGGQSHTITASADSNGTITPQSATVAAGYGKTFSITASTGYAIKTIKLDGVDITGSANGQTEYNCNVMDVQTDAALSVEFAPLRTVTASTGGNGKITLNGSDETSVQVIEGGSVSYTVTADSGYVIDMLTVDGTLIPEASGRGESSPYSGTYSVTSEDVEIKATFKQQATHKITVTTEYPGEGTAIINIPGLITPPLINFSGEKTIEGIADGRQVTISIGMLNSSYVIKSILLNGVEELKDGEVTSKQLDETITEDWTLKIVFGLPTVTYSVSASVQGEGGTIATASGETGEIEVEEGGELTFTITAASGYYIEDISDYGTTLEESYDDWYHKGSYNLTLSDIRNEHEISVIFAQAPVTYTITASAGENGTIAPGGDVTATEGEEPEFKITAEAGYVIDKLLVNGAEVSAASGLGSYTYIFPPVTSNGQTISVTFKPAASTEEPTTPTEPTNPETPQQTGGGGGGGCSAGFGALALLAFVPLALRRRK